MSQVTTPQAMPAAITMDTSWDVAISVTGSDGSRALFKVQKSKLEGLSDYFKKFFDRSHFGGNNGQDGIYHLTEDTGATTTTLSLFFHCVHQNHKDPRDFRFPDQYYDVPIAELWRILTLVDVQGIKHIHVGKYHIKLRPLQYWFDTWLERFTARNKNQTAYEKLLYPAYVLDKSYVGQRGVHVPGPFAIVTKFLLYHSVGQLKERSPLLEQDSGYERYYKGMHMPEDIIKQQGPGLLKLTNMSFAKDKVLSLWHNKRAQVVLFSSTAIALYGYDQGMMSLINTNYNYLATMGIASDDPLVGWIVSVYYLGCAVGAVVFSKVADRWGRKRSIFACLAMAALGNLVMFVTGMWGKSGALQSMFLGRVIMGLGVGGIDAVIPIYSSELADDEARGKALAQEFQMNIFGLNMAFGINLIVTRLLGKTNEWAWRIPIVVMQVYPVALMLCVESLPESPRWFIYQGRDDDARKALEMIYGGKYGEGEEGEGDRKFEDLKKKHDDEVGDNVSYWDMFTPSHDQFHPTVITIMVQINQALTGYGAVSVYGPQIFSLLGFDTVTSENLTMANYLSYFVLMTFAWVLIDALGRRILLLWGSFVLTICFLLLALFGGLAMNSYELGLNRTAIAIPGVVSLFVATGAFGIGWLATVWLVPTEIFPTTARAQAAAVSVIIWGLANFAITFLTPIMFNNLAYYIYLVFAGTNAVAGIWTYFYLPESGNRSFEDNVQFFTEARKVGSWSVSHIKNGEWKSMPYGDVLLDGSDEAREQAPLLQRVADQVQ
ncbi:putative Major facilitator superfamily (MFS) profile domain-containing protein [Seiridium unicorne]|uniref:Major facilitator superfamily (MFS) profile domain-containing protein n=1 Tax=Seiridium unicorne TaxID=138068 RepID=A0ABR2UUQ6_9PEZI